MTSAPSEQRWAPEPVGVSPDQLREGMSHFASGVTVVTTLLGGVKHAMTATAFSSVSLRPPLVLICVGKTSRFHPAVLASGTWAVSVLTSDQRSTAEHFAHSGRDLATQFDDVDHDPAPFSGAPVLRAASTWLDCRTWAAHDAGDHTVVIGLVLGVAGADSEASGPAGPLTYHRGSYRAG